MVPMFLKSVDVRVPSYEQPNEKKPTQPYIKVRVLVDGADDFLTLGCKTHVVPGKYDMKIAKRDYDKMCFFDLLEATPVK